MGKTIRIVIELPDDATVSISSSSSSEDLQVTKKPAKRQSKKEEKKSKMPKIRDVDDLLKFTGGDKEYARAIIRKYNLHGISYGNKLYVVTPQFLKLLEEKKTDMKDLEEAIESGEAVVIKPENLAKLL